MALLVPCLLALLACMSPPSALARPMASDSDVTRMVYSFMQNDFAEAASALMLSQVTGNISAELAAGHDVTFLVPTDTALSAAARTCSVQQLVSLMDRHILRGRVLGEALADDPVGHKYSGTQGFVLMKAQDTPIHLALVRLGQGVGGVLHSATSAEPAVQELVRAEVVRPDAFVSRHLVAHGVSGVFGSCKEASSQQPSELSKDISRPTFELKPRAVSSRAMVQ